MLQRIRFQRQKKNGFSLGANNDPQQHMDGAVQQTGRPSTHMHPLLMPVPRRPVPVHVRTSGNISGPLDRHGVERTVGRCKLGASLSQTQPGRRGPTGNLGTGFPTISLERPERTVILCPAQWVRPSKTSFRPLSLFPGGQEWARD